MAATASIVIEVQDGQATAALQKLNAQVAQTGATLQPVQRISEQTFNNIEGGALKARESAALLGEEFGVKVPRALRGVIAQSSLLGPIFTAAFSGLAVIGFVEIVKQAVEQLTGFGEALKAIEKQNTELMQSAAAASKTLLGPQTLEQVNTRILDTEKSVAALNERLGLTGSLFGDALTRGVAKYNMQQQLSVEELDKQKTLLNDLYGEQAKLLDAQNRTEPIEVLKLTNAARLAGLEGIAKINAAEKEETAVIRAEMNARITTHRVGTAEINKVHAEAAASRAKLERDVAIQGAQAILQAEAVGLKGREQLAAESAAKLHQIQMQEDKLGIQLVQQREALTIESLARLADMERQNAEEVIRAQEQAAVDILPPWQRSYAQLSMDTQRRLREIQQALKDTRISAEDAAKLSAAAWQEEYAKVRDKLASDLESAFDEITSGGIGQFFLKKFKHLVFEMIATWMLGMQQMRSASQQQIGSGGGILGAIFGSIFGGGGGFGGGASGGPGGTPTFAASFGADGGLTSGLPTALSGGELAAISPLIGIGLSGGQGAGALGTVMPAGAGPGGAAAGAAGMMGGQMGQLLAKIFPNGLSIGGVNISGSMLAAGGIALLSDAFRKGGVLRGLEGAAGGALTGFAIGGPIGAIIGGIVGFIAGIWGKSTKKARLAIEADIKRQATTIEDAYNLFQTDWTGSRTALEALRAQGVAALQQAGVKDINRSRVGHVDQWIDKAEKEIDATQAERNRRGAMVFGPAQFRVGGLVGPNLGGPVPAWFAASAMHFAGGGAVPAILHEGEYVMRPEAVSRIGPGNLSRMNSGGSGGGDTHVHVHTMDSQSFAEWLRGGGLKEILRETRRAQNEGWA